MHLRTLGTLELDGADFGHPKPLLLLAYLARAGPQPRQRLATLFWPRSSRARNTLSVTLSRLRKAVPGAVSADDERVWTTLRTDVDDLEDALEQERWSDAADLYRGAFLEGVRVQGIGEELEEWIAASASHLARLVQVALLGAAERAARAGRLDGAAELTEAVAALGTSELEPHELARLHTLLVAGGSARSAEIRRAAAEWDLELYSTRAEALRRLGALPAPVAVDHNLRPRTTSFFGRRRELGELATMLGLADHRVVTLVGPGGIGKSRLAWQAAYQERERPGSFDACWYVELEGVAAAEDVPQRIVDTLGLPVGAGPATVDDVARSIGGRRVLLVLDNCEHLVGVDACVSALVARCPGTTVLATSRDRLRLAEEWCYPVCGFASPDASPDAGGELDRSALELFEARARRTDPRFRLRPEDEEHVAAICRLTGGSPLALELAAGCASTRTLPVMAADISRSLDVLTTRLRNVSERHRSIRAVFDHTWRRLPDAEREALRRLAVFREGFDAEMARAVAGAAPALLASLVAQSLIVQVDGDRFERHPLVHEYTSEALDRKPEVRARVAGRHAAFFQDLAQEARAQFDGPDGGEWLERLEANHANLEAALAWTEAHGSTDDLVALAVALVPFWVRRSLHRNALRWLDRVVQRGGGATDRAAYARSLQYAAYTCLLTGAYDVALSLIDRCERVFEQLGDVAGTLRARSLAGMRAVYLGAYDEARRTYDAALAVAREHGCADVTSRLLNNLGDVAWLAGDLSAARAYYDESLGMVRAQRNYQMTSNVLGSLGMVALEEGQVAEARRRILESLRLVDDLGIAFSLPTALEQLACVATALGEPLRAASLWGAADGLRTRLRIMAEPFTRRHRDAWAARARQAADPHAFVEAWEDARRAELAPRLAVDPAQERRPWPAVPARPGRSARRERLVAPAGPDVGRPDLA